MNKIFCSLFVMVLSPALLAAEVDESDFIGGDVPLVLTGTRLKQKAADVPASVTVIDRQMIRASGARDVPSLLRLVPGFMIGHEADRVSVTYHGNADSYSRRLQVLVDGRTLYTPALGGMEWYEFPVAVEDIERIEVIRGPNGASYGSNSFIAVVNIITRHPGSVTGNLVRLDLSGNYNRLYTRHAHSVGKYNYRVGLSQYYSKGFPGNFDGNSRFNLDYRGELQLQGSKRLEFSFGFNRGPHKNGTTNPLQPLRTSTRQSNFQHVRYVNPVSADEEISLRFFHNYHRYNDKFHTTIPGPISFSFSNSMNVHRYSLDLQHNKRVNKKLQLVWGAEIREDTIDGLHEYGLYGGQHTSTQTFRLYLNGEYRVTPSWLLNAGVLVENNDLIGTESSPRLALNWQAGKNQTLRAVWSKAIRIPSALEDRANTVVNGILNLTVPVTDIVHVGNQNLRPEKITSFEIGYLGKFLKGRLQLDVRLFREKIRDTIVLYRDNDNFTDINNRADVFINDGFSNLTGWEMQLDYRFSKSTRLVLAYANVDNDGRIRLRLTGGVPAYQDLSRTTPEHTLSALLMHRMKDGTNLSFGFYRFSSLEWIGGDVTGNASILDVRMAKKFRYGRYRGQYEFVIRNGLGDYFNFDSDYVHKPSVLFSLSLGK